MNKYSIMPGQDYRDLTLRDGAALSSDELLEDAVKHYDDCYRDYLAAWCNRDNLALHYGYWNEPGPYRHHQALLNKNQLLYEKAGIAADDHVLDAGCGIGGSSIWIAKHYRNRVTGITISAKQANYAFQHAKRHNVDKLVNFEIADFCQTPFPDDSFDIVWALESSCHALHKDRFIGEAFRILKKGGRLVVCDGFLLKREFTEDQWRAMVTCLNGWAVPNLCTQDEFSGYLRDSGFQNIQIHDITDQTRPSSDYMLKVAKRLYMVQKISQWLGLRSKAQTANYYVGLAQHRFFTDNFGVYCIYTAQK